jgi:hypothetical protein
MRSKTIEERVEYEKPSVEEIDNGGQPLGTSPIVSQT